MSRAQKLWKGVLDVTDCMPLLNVSFLTVTVVCRIASSKEPVE